MRMLKLFFPILTIMILACNNGLPQEEEVHQEIHYSFPEERQRHEGTWLQWPHHYQYGIKFRDDLDPTWIALVEQLIDGEKVFIIAYDQTEKNRISALLTAASIPLENVHFYIYPNDDFWVRDNGPIYVHDLNGDLVIQDWGFNGWGNKAAYQNCNQIPSKIGLDQNIPVIDLNDVMINEGGSVELDGRGTLMACKSSILNENRNPGMSQSQAEKIFTKYLGATNFIWLDGQAGLEITDQHIDGFARFAHSTTIVTMDREDLMEFDVKPSDMDLIYGARDRDGELYDFLILPLTKHSVVTTYGQDLNYKGSYCNYYIANNKVIVPIYNDPNDDIALELLQGLFPNREVVGIDFRNVYANGGMVHCVTQQQPLR